MGYSGYSQLLCNKGHYWIKDCYEMDWLQLKDHKCFICKRHAIWENVVNTTNGSFDDNGNRIDNYIELKVKIKRGGICSACGKEHVCEIRYEVPKKKTPKHKISKSYKRNKIKRGKTSSRKIHRLK